MKNKKDYKLGFNDYNDLIVICKCGCHIHMPVYRDKLECRWCGKTVHNKTKLHFKYKLRKGLEL